MTKSKGKIGVENRNTRGREVRKRKGREIEEKTLVYLGEKKEKGILLSCLGTMISFGNLKLVQIYCLTNQKFSNLNLGQIPPSFLK